MISKSKQAATIANLLHKRVAEPIVAANSVAELLRQAVIDNDLTGQFTSVELSALQTFVSDLALLAANPVIAALSNRYVKTHSNNALIITGVNDG